MKLQSHLTVLIIILRSVIDYSQVGIITERNFLVQWRHQDLARGGAHNDIEIT